MKKAENWKRLLSVILAAALVTTTAAPGTVRAAGASTETETSQVKVVTDADSDSDAGSEDVVSGNESESKKGESSETENSAPDSSTGVGGEKQDDSAKKEETKKTENAGAAAEQNVYADGSIRIYNAKQLEAVGSGNQVYSGDESADTFGTGDAVTDENGSAVVYGNDASYVLMNDITLDSANIWQLPDGFAGSFSGTGGSAESKLYDAETDTIYVYNNYQLATINDPDALKTVMSNDMIAEDFGMGQIVFADEAKETQLEYTAEHNYVLTTEFTSEMPELKAQALVANDGRKFQGQVI